MKVLGAVVLAVVMTGAVFACGGGSPVTMTVNTTATFDAAPASYSAPSEGGSDAEVM